ncbi:MAG TPA: response regulator transcription factor [Candidatus Bathyarchaeia archaeon]|jgi:two-component system KDP operon response regulator KdpE|nr:response regulator transcription factor [Candidatus Bathyarchaeia archaeon]
MIEPSRVLIVDDEGDVTRVLQAVFASEGYSARTADDGSTALQIMREWEPDLIITDLSMPNVSGIALCREVRKTSAVPIIVLSVREQETTKVEALNSGADDYVTKPFGTDELLARVRATLRRTKQPMLGIRLLHAGDFCLDRDTYTVQIKSREVRLTPKEFQLLEFLMQNVGRVLTHKMLLSAVWERSYTEMDSVRTLVKQLRKKIEPNPSSPRYLKTEPWIGYRFSPGE